MYKEDHREKLTRYDVQKRLQGTTKDIVFIILVFVVPVLFLSLFYLLNDTVLSIIIAIISVITLVILAYYLVAIGKNRMEASHGKFTVTETELHDIQTVVRTKYSITRRTIIDEHKKVFHFTNGMTYSERFYPDSPKKYHDNYDTRIAFSMEHSNSGDKFYIVTLDSNSKNVMMIFSGVIFKYVEG